eukprot:10811279-Prorocentrum_lima.AAC.1
MAAPPAAVPLSLHLDIKLGQGVLGCQFLYNAVTGEKALLPGGGVPWELEEHEGVQYLCTDAESIW